MKRFLIPVFLFICLFNAKAGDTKIDIGAYVDAYIATDNNRADASLNANRLFSYVNPRKDQFSINTAQISARIYSPNSFRSNITLHTGDLHKTGWVNAGASMPIVQQANAGVRLYDNVWIDGGIFLTHIGGESLLPKDNWLSTHSMVTYFEPFYQSGARASYESESFTAQFHILNGNGLFDENNYNKTLGWFLSYTPSALLTVSVAGVAGNEEPSPLTAKTHMLHNLVAQVNPFEGFSVKGQLDYASKDITDPANQSKTISGSYLGYSLTAHYLFTGAISATARLASVNNGDGIYAPAVEGLDISLGAEYKPGDNSFVRLEGRTIRLDDKYKIFSDGKAPTASRMELVLNMGVWFN